MNAGDALAFVEKRGVVLVSARGAVPRLTEAIIGESIKGGWWSHPRGREIYAVLQAVTASPDVLVCKLVDGKVTLVHKRLWPALARVAARFAPERIAQVSEEHTPSGRHEKHELAFPDWAPAEVLKEAKLLGEAEALAQLASLGVAP
jgi:hypothetical protein